MALRPSGSVQVRHSGTFENLHYAKTSTHIFIVDKTDTYNSEVTSIESVTSVGSLTRPSSFQPNLPAPGIQQNPVGASNTAQASDMAGVLVAVAAPASLKP